MYIICPGNAPEATPFIVYSAIYPLTFLDTEMFVPPIISITLPRLLVPLFTKNPKVFYIFPLTFKLPIVKFAFSMLFTSKSFTYDPVSLRYCNPPPVLISPFPVPV